MSGGVLLHGADPTLALFLTQDLPVVPWSFVRRLDLWLLRLGTLLCAGAEFASRIASTLRKGIAVPDGVKATSEYQDTIRQVGRWCRAMI